TLCTGDLFIWVVPNAGNPQKVQRYPHEWAIALRTMEALGAELLCPGHGYPIRGAARVHQALAETAELLESLHDQTVAMMNAGARLDDIVHSVRAPAHLLARPYLQPVYDEPEFVVRNVWRLYGGWYDGNPAHLKPAPEAALAAELARLAGGAGRLADRAAALAAEGDLALACQLAELAAEAAPGDAAIRAVRGVGLAAHAAVVPYDFTGHWTGTARTPRKPAAMLSADLTSTTPPELTGTLTIVTTEETIHCTVSGRQRRRVVMAAPCDNTG